MIQDVGYSGNLDQPNRWHSVSALRISQHPQNHLKECRTLMYLITKAIDSQCRRRRDLDRALEEIRRLFAIYITLSSYARQAEMEEVRILMNDENSHGSSPFISELYYEHELIHCK